MVQENADGEGCAEGQEAVGERGLQAIMLRTQRVALRGETIDGQLQGVVGGHKRRRMKN